jgi:Protein of unknown function (DUF2917)
MKNTAIFSPLVATIDAECIGYELVKDKAMTLPQRNAVVIQCRAGLLWLTIAGNGKDYFLRAGESIACHRDRAVVIEAMNDVARFQVCDN